MKIKEKTNVMRVLDGKRISYQSHTYEPDATLTGEEIAGLLGENPEKVFKTLVARGKSGTCFVFLMLMTNLHNFFKIQVILAFSIPTVNLRFLSY